MQNNSLEDQQSVQSFLPNVDLTCGSLSCPEVSHYAELIGPLGKETEDETAGSVIERCLQNAGFCFLWLEKVVVPGVTDDEALAGC